MTAWRIFKPRHAKTAFRGEGARQFGGRWNNIGTAVVYTSSSASLAALEVLVHLHSTEILEAYWLKPVTFDTRLVKTISMGDLPANWRLDSRRSTLQALGDRWAAAQQTAVLRVPSAVIDGEYNYLLNPAHPHFARIKIGRRKNFLFDPRLLK